MSSFFESVGTEIEPSKVNSKSKFISSSSNLCNVFKNLSRDLINVSLGVFWLGNYK